MPWLIGIDEAGYGPNLGPFVMSSVACQVPDAHVEANLWKILKKAVRRKATPADSRLFIEDSKLVYSSTKGLADLERSVLAAVLDEAMPLSLRSFLEMIACDACDSLAAEFWFHGTTQLPLENGEEDFSRLHNGLHEECEKQGVSWGLRRSVVVCTPAFNQLLVHWGSKGAVLGHALIRLLNANVAACSDDQPLHFFIDKHGGRNNYAAMLQSAFPDGMVMAHEEGMDRSSYRVYGPNRDIRITIQPRADSTHLPVALASMVSKYLREALMAEFNEFWLKKVPALEPTAGYPTDATRFMDEIRPHLLGLGLAEDAVWRRK